jgi:hypothetical protein
VKYADDLLLLAKAETVLQGTLDRLIETEKCCGMEMNVEKTKATKISREMSPLQIMIDQKEPENMEYFKYLGNMINDVRCTYEIKYKIVIAKAAFNTKKTLFHQQIGLKFNEETSELINLDHSILWC